MTRLKKLPVRKQTFADFPEQGYLYVDKTELIHRMITEKTACFLSRPRRFGKSLLVPTLEAIFQGRRELFKDLWLEKLFESREFGNWWFETGTPFFLIDLIRNRPFDLSGLEQKQVGNHAFFSFDVDRLDVVPLLIQTGYLTITGYNPDRRLYILDYPNREVRESFLTSLAEVFFRIRARRSYE